MQKKIQLGILFGGRSGEHDVSLMSTRSVLNVLSREKYEITQIGITREGVWVSGENVLEALEKKDVSGLSRVALRAEPNDNWLYVIREQGHSHILEQKVQLDVIFPVLHGTFGEDGTLQGLLEMADLAYVGGGVLSSSVGMDKGLFKYVMQACAIPSVAFKVFNTQQIEQNLEQIMDECEAMSPYPMFVKPVNLGSSVGISKCSDRPALKRGILKAVRYDRRVIIERGINAREIEVSVLGNNDPKASVPGEITPSDEFYSYNAKYIDGKSGLTIPAHLSPADSERIRELAVKAFLAIDGAGMARVDFLLDKDNGEIYLSEVNMIPGFTQISMYPKLWEASGLSYAALIDRLVELALDRKAERDRLVRSFDTETES